METLGAGTDLNLQDGSRVAVIGGGPAGSFFTYFLLKMAEEIDLELEVDVFEPRFFFLHLHQEQSADFRWLVLFGYVRGMYRP